MRCQPDQQYRSNAERKVARAPTAGVRQLVGSNLTESGVLDRAVLNRQIEEILDGLSEKLEPGAAHGTVVRGFPGAL